MPDNLDPTGRDDSTGAIEYALDVAARSARGGQLAAGNVYWTTRPTVRLPAGVYRTTRAIRMPKAVNIVSDGAVLQGDGSHDGLTWDHAWRATVRGLTFLDYATALRMPTGNLDEAMIHVDHCGAQRCRAFVDTVSYAASRSTLVKLSNCIVDTAQVRVYADQVNLDSCWFYHSGQSEAAIVLDGNASVTNCVGVPRGDFHTAPERRWIDFHAIDLARSLAVRDCRFGAESGGITLVHNYAAGNVDFLASDLSQVCITIDTVKSCPVMAGPGRRCSVLLYAMPNGIDLRQVNGSEHADGIVAVHPSMTVPAPTEANLRRYSIAIDRPTRRLREYWGQDVLPASLVDYLRWD